MVLPSVSYSRSSHPFITHQRNHQLFRYGYRIVETADFSLVAFKNGPAFWVYALYSYLMAAATGFILQRNFQGHNVIRRRQILLISSAIAFFILVDILFQAGITPVRGYTLSPAAMSGAVQRGEKMAKTMDYQLEPSSI